MSRLQIILLVAAVILFTAAVLMFIDARPHRKKPSKKSSSSERVRNIIAAAVGICSILSFLFAQFAVTGEPAFKDIYYNYDDHTVNGSVSNVGNTKNYRVALFIYTSKGWQSVTPDLSVDESRLFKADRSTASFSITAYRLENYADDILAEKYTVFLLPADKSEGDMTHYNAVNRISIQRAEREIDNETAVLSPVQPSESPSIDISPSLPEPSLGEVYYEQEKKAVSGTVEGVEELEYDQYRVALMIYTDDWYIKPYYSAGNPGASLSVIESDGSFTVNAYRLYPAELTDEVTKVAIFLIPADYTGPTRQNDYYGISAASIDSWELDL